jgi:hypothetical protein
MNTIKIRISNAAQRAHLLATGDAASREQSYDVPADLLPRLLALPWTCVDSAGVATCDVPPDLQLRGSRYDLDDGSPFSAEWLRGAGYNLDSIEYSVADTRPVDAAGAHSAVFTRRPH